MEKNQKIARQRVSRVGMNKISIQKSFRDNLYYNLAKDKYTATNRDNFMAAALAIRDRLVKRWITTQQRHYRRQKKRVYYLSMEFLIGRLFSNNIMNLGISNETRAALRELGYDFEDICEQEADAGLGNGGLGRLAACFLDSMATLGIAGHGYGIRYDYGIFHQKIIDGRQVECPDEWSEFGYPWEFERPEFAMKVQLYGQVEHYDDQGVKKSKWVNTHDVLAVPYDIFVPGYQNNVVNTLRLWSAASSEAFDFSYFRHGDYERAVQDQIVSENISKVLYPSDELSQGKELRLKQEYFFTAASIADIVRRFKKRQNYDFKNFPKRVAIQLNDTHPTLAIVELMRVLVDQEGLEWNTAWSIVRRTFAYTNHTVMPEALEKWPVPLLERLLPRHLEIIYDLNERFMRQVSRRSHADLDKMKRMSIIEEGDPKYIRMAHLCILASGSVNGVSQLHSNILKTTLFKDFYEMFPHKFNNKTNGVNHRRWLLEANTRLAELITDAIGDTWVKHPHYLEQLLPLQSDPAFINRWREVKQQNKEAFAHYLKKYMHIEIDPHFMLDVQVKRMHEYKRQLLFTLYIITEYLKLRNSPQADMVPRTFIIGGKAAPDYFMAKLVIKLINNVAQVMNADHGMAHKLKVIFLENYRVSLAEKIFPASDLSEQISTAGTEASGTGCMKFMMNGALTIGTHDGANIEIAEAVGADNTFTFGLHVEQINDLRRQGYQPQAYIERSPLLQESINLIATNVFSGAEEGIFDPIVQSLREHDPYFVCADFDAYVATQGDVNALYATPEVWTRKAIVNVAKSGRFSSDRTIKEYALDIWHVACKV